MYRFRFYPTDNQSLYFNNLFAFSPAAALYCTPYIIGMKTVRTGLIGKLEWVIEEINNFLLLKENEKPEGERRIKKYQIDIRDRDVQFPVIKDEKVIGTKKGYYGTIVLCYTLDSKTYLVWREHYQFANATERRRDYLWKERVCDKILYEAMGVFLTMAEEETPKEYDIEEDQFTDALNEIKGQISQAEASDNVVDDLIQGK